MPVQKLILRKKKSQRQINRLFPDLRETLRSRMTVPGQDLHMILQNQGRHMILQSQDRLMIHQNQGRHMILQSQDLTKGKGKVRMKKYQLLILKVIRESRSRLQTV